VAVGKGLRPILLLSLAGLLGAVAATIGCAGKGGSGERGKVVSAEQWRSEGREVLGGGAGGSAAGKGQATGVPTTRGDWAIAIASLRGPERQSAAAVALHRFRTEGGLPEAYIQERGEASVIVYGHYTGPEDPRVKPDLERLWKMEYSGVYPYALAFLAPPERIESAIVSEYDLRRAKQVYGKAAVYTLQIGRYGREDLPRPTEADLAEARKLAEAAAIKLRQEGELAFFYHGRTVSHVTIGVFDERDFQPARDLDPFGKPTESQRLRELRQRFPYDLYNGAGYKFKTRGMTEAKLAQSRLVAIPAPR
jgi:hypothetical protein